MPFVTFIARRHLKIRHQRKLVRLITVLATIGVCVGVMVLMVVIAVMSGFQSELRKRILGIEAHLLVMRYSEWMRDYQSVAERIMAIPEVASASPFVYSQGMLRSPDNATGIVLRGIDPERSGIVVGIKGDKGLDRLLARGVGEDMPIPVVLGTVLAEKLNVKADDEVMLMVDGSAQVRPATLPRTRRLKVAGLFETGMHQYDGTIGFVNIHRLQEAIGVGDVVTGIEVRLHDAQAVEMTSRTIHEQIGGGYWTNHWKQMHRNLFSMLALQKVMMYVILTLIIVVGAFNIVSALVMMVKEKAKDIAILKAMGADNRAVEKIFLYKGMAIGICGIGLGLCAGLLLCSFLARHSFIELPGDVYFLTTLPVRIIPVDLAIIALGTLVICFVASFFPARKAARMKPVDGLRDR